MTSFVVVGMPKTGTSALYSAIKQERPFLSIYETFNHKQVDYLLNEDDENKITKVLTPRVLDIPVNLGRFDKQVLTVRDPRDMLISWLLYRPFVRQNYTRLTFIEAFVEALRGKERDPSSISVRGLYRLLGKHGVAYTRHRDFRAHFASEAEVLRQYPTVHQARYEDFVDGDLQSASRYLGLTIRNETSLGSHVRFNERSKSYGAWRHWFTAEDIEVYRPLMQRYLELKGYDPDWDLVSKPHIDSATSSEHVVRNVERLRRCPESTGHLLTPELYTPERIAMLRSAVEDGRETAMVELALAYHKGYGVPASTVEARRLLVDASARGNPEARRRLLLLPRVAASPTLKVTDVRQALSDQFKENRLREVIMGSRMDRMTKGAASRLRSLSRGPRQTVTAVEKRVANNLRWRWHVPANLAEKKTDRGSSALQQRRGRASDMPIGPGSHPARVRKVQLLVNHSTTQKVNVDGVYGPKTHAAVAFLQKRLELPPTGLADAMTLVYAHARLEERYRRANSPRTIRLALPSASAHDAETLILTAPYKMYIPSVLERVGFAGYEPETLAIWLAALEVLGAGHVLDVGANIGIFSLLAAARSNRDVIAFEPTADLAGVARSTAAANGLRVEVEELALGDRNGFATLYLSDVTDASNSLSTTFRPSTTSVPVPVATLDSYVERTGISPVLCKIDTETTEPAVLRGAHQLLSRGQAWIICEVLPGEGSEELSQVLAPYDYQYRPINDNYPLREEDKLHGHDTYRNWLFTPTRPTEEFWESAGRWRTALRACTPLDG